MDAIVGEAGSLRAKVEGAQTALAIAIAKANLTGDPLGPALEAMSDSLGAQLALHQANTGHFRDVTTRLDVSVADAIRGGEQALDARRIAIVCRATIKVRIPVNQDEKVSGAWGEGRA